MNIKKAIIIGASSGIGKGISLELLNKGYKIAISARRKERLDEIKKLNSDMVIVKEYDSSTEKNDELIAKKLAFVLTGGDKAGLTKSVDEQYLLDIEREAFVSLAGEPLTQDRIRFMLKKGKPLRN